MPRCLHQLNNDLPNMMYKNETKNCMLPASDVEGVPSVLVSQTEGRSTVNKSLNHGSVVLGACQHQRCPRAKKEYGLEASLASQTHFLRKWVWLARLTRSMLNTVYFRHSL